MCGRFAQQRPTAELAELFEAEPLVDDPGGHFNLAPTDPAAVVVERGDRRAITTYAWGLLPSWEKDPRSAARRINARAETVATSPAFADSFRRRRCIVPADGFYEWRRDGPRRRPFFIRSARRRAARPGRPVVRLARPARPTPRGARSRSSRRPRTSRSPALHDRMPVVLEPDAWALWLDPEVGRRRRAPRPAPTGARAIRSRSSPVRPLVNNVRNDGPELHRAGRRGCSRAGQSSASPPALAGRRPPLEGDAPGPPRRSSSAANAPTVRAKTPSGIARPGPRARSRLAGARRPAADRRPRDEDDQVAPA